MGVTEGGVVELTEAARSDAVDAEGDFDLEALRRDARAAQEARGELDNDIDIDALTQYVSQSADQPNQASMLLREPPAVIAPKGGVGAVRDFTVDWDETAVDFVIPPDPNENPGLFTSIRSTVALADLKGRWKDDMSLRMASYVVAAVVLSVGLSQIPGCMGLGT